MSNMKINPASRRRFIQKSAIATGLLGGLSIPFLTQQVKAAPRPNQDRDIAILNAALDLENQAIWAYSAAAGKLSNTPTGQTILMLAKRNLMDHQAHAKLLTDAIKGFGKTPSPARPSYDLSSYINAGEGNLNSDVNIAKLALALEYDAALAYIDAFNKLTIPALLAAAGTIAPNEVAHATAIRAVFRSVMPSVEFVPEPFVSAAARKNWVLKV